MKEGPFRGRTLGWIVGIALTSLLLGSVLSIFSEDFFGIPSFENDAYSPSAVGHEAFVELLREFDIPVLVSRSDTELKLGPRSALVLAEPIVDSENDERIRDLVAAAETVLVVLPKRRPWPSMKSRWIGGAELHPEERADEVLRSLGLDSETEVVRSGLGPDQVQWDRGGYAVNPSIDAPQLIVSEELIPLISCPTGMLLAWRASPSQSLYVLADPDLIATHGLEDGANAALALEIFERCLAQDGRTVVIDEVIHGHGGKDGVFRRLFRYPLVLATVQALVILVTLLWAGLGRFGAPRPVPPHLEAGKELLISNTAQLLRFCGHSGHAVRHMYRATIRELANRFHAPSSLKRREIPGWLEQVSRSRGVDIDLADLSARVNALGRRRWENEHQVLRTAKRIHRWKKEILHAAGGDKRP